LDAPKAPMNPAWVSVLRYSCWWASQAQDAPTAARKVTNALHLWGTYNGGVTAFTSNETDIWELFHLRDFIQSGLMGQCNDFADFLLCLQTSLGVSGLKVQRTHALFNRGFSLVGHQVTVVSFTTNRIDVAPWGTNGGTDPNDGIVTWVYHQYCLNVASSLVWDGALQLWPSYRVAITGMPCVPDYRDGLVQSYTIRVDNGPPLVVYPYSSYWGQYWECYWGPTPPDGFIPGVTAQNANP